MYLLMGEKPQSREADSVCHHCGKRGHLAKVCFGKKQGQGKYTPANVKPGE